MLNAKGDKIDQVSYNHLKSNDGSIQHAGDNLTGEGDGDDEVITINLNKVPYNVDSLWPVVTIYTRNKNFSQVKGAYCRVVESRSNKEFCNFNLSLNLDRVSNGNIVANFKRAGQGWTMKARGYYTSGTYTQSDIYPRIYELINNDFSKIKILKKDNSQPRCDSQT